MSLPEKANNSVHDEQGSHLQYQETNPRWGRALHIKYRQHDQYCIADAHSERAKASHLDTKLQFLSCSQCLSRWVDDVTWWFKDRGVSSGQQKRSSVECESGHPIAQDHFFESVCFHFLWRWKEKVPHLQVPLLSIRLLHPQLLQKQVHDWDTTKEFRNILSW